ncbi:MAG: hypothetical protein JXA30_01485 [Deltaproteobacteria bacterium]|nr:hypothetical protein [Deltaproteobacteria bacterium]
MLDRPGVKVGDGLVAREPKLAAAGISAPVPPFCRCKIAKSHAGRDGTDLA